jgi:hypothetical protein
MREREWNDLRAMTPAALIGKRGPAHGRVVRLLTGRFPGGGPIGKCVITRIILP